MTIQSNDRRKTYVGNGVTFEFSGPRAFSADDIAVYRVNNATQQADEISTGFYAVSGLGGTATLITLTDAATIASITSAYTLLILRTVDYDQQANFTNQGAYLPQTHETALDKIVMQVQQVADVQERTLRLADTVVGLSSEIGSVTPLAPVVVNADGTGFAMGSTVLTGDMLLRPNLTDGTDATFSQEGTGAVPRAQRQKSREVVSPEDYGCVGDGVTDDTVNMQKALDAIAAMGGGTLRFARKKTYLTGYCTISGNTIVDLNNSVWDARPSLAAGEPLLSNKNFAGLAVNATSDNHITIRNGEFRCTIAADRTTGLVEFYKCGDLRLYNVRITGPKYRGVLVYGCKRVWIDRCKVDGYGKAAVTPEGGSAIHVTAHFDGSTSDDAWITRNYILNGEWSAITITGNRMNVVGNHILTVKEAGIFGQPNEGVIRGNVISGVTKKDISASGIELGGDYITIDGNVVRDVNNVGISLTDVQNASVTNNRTINVRRDAATFPTGCHISILSQSASPNQPRDIKVSGNTAADYSSPSSAAVRVEGSGAGAAPINLDISGNHFQGTAWASGQAVYLNATYWTQASCRHANNAGADDTARACMVYLAPDLSIPHNTNTIVSWAGATVNSKGPGNIAMWVIGAPTRITVPKDVKRLRVDAAAGFAANATGNRQVTVLKNGVIATGQGRATQANAGAADPVEMSVHSAVLDVTAGDYIELRVWQNSGGALNLLSGNAGTWMCVTVLE